MSHSNGIIKAPVAMSDVQAVIGSQSTDLGTLCSHININKFARFKPVRYPSVGLITNANRQSVAHGIVFPDVVIVSQITGAAIQDAAANDWDYQLPVGGASSPYRLSDFGNVESRNSDGYFHGAVPPIQVVYPRDGWVFMLGDVQRTLNIFIDLDPDDSGRNLQAFDFVSAGLNLNEWTLVAYVDDPQKMESEKIVEAQDTILNGGEISGDTIVVPFAPRTTGTYNIDVYICMYRTNNSEGGRKELLPLPKQGDYNPSVFKLKIVDDAEASGGGIPGRDTEEMFNNIAFAPSLDGALDPDTHTLVYKTAWDCTDNGTAKWLMRGGGDLYVRMLLKNGSSSTSNLPRGTFQVDIEGTGPVSATTMYDENKRVISSVSIASGGTATIYLHFQELFQRIGADWDMSASDPYNNDNWSIDFTRNGATLIGGDIYAKKGTDGWIKRST